MPPKRSNISRRTAAAKRSRVVRASENEDDHNLRLQNNRILTFIQKRRGGEVGISFSGVGADPASAGSPASLLYKVVSSVCVCVYVCNNVCVCDEYGLLNGGSDRKHV